MVLRMMLCSFMGMMFGVLVVPVGYMSVMRCFFVVTGYVSLMGEFVMCCCFLVMSSCFFVMIVFHSFFVLFKV
jgi:hypothetical protein